MKILVIDGKGGGIGRRLIERLENIQKNIKVIYAVGTNATATAQMLSSNNKLVQGATGTNPVKVLAPQVDVIVGPIAIISSNSMLGEITPEMANAVSNSSARKILLPLNKCSLKVVGVKKIALDELIDEAIDEIKTTKVK